MTSSTSLNFSYNQPPQLLSVAMVQWMDKALTESVPVHALDHSSSRKLEISASDFLEKMVACGFELKVKNVHDKCGKTTIKPDSIGHSCLSRDDSFIYFYVDSNQEGEAFTGFFSYYKEGSGEVAVRRALKEYLSCTVKPKETYGYVYMLMMTQNGPVFNALRRKVSSPLEVGNYTPEVVKDYLRIKTDLESSSPAGRIGIFDGPPGSGKTHLLKALLTEADKTVFVFVSPQNLVGMTGPDVLPALIDFSAEHEGKSITLLVEDADECIAPRMGDNMSAVSGVLNLGDGILGQLLDIRLIMTTNAKRQQFDVAITRPGRLSALVKVDVLPVAQCAEVFKRLTGKDRVFDKPATLAELYSLALDNGWTAVVKEQPIGFQTKQSDNKVLKALLSSLEQSADPKE